MSQETSEKVMIENEEYEIYMLTPRLSHHLLLDLLKIVGPSLGAVFDKAAANKNLLDQDVGSTIGTDLFDKLDPVIIDKMIDAFSEITLVDGKQLSKIFDAHFLGRLHVMYIWMFNCMRIQWGKSLSALLSNQRSVQQSALAKRVPKRSQSLRT